MPSAAEIAAYADSLLRVSEISDYANAQNGLQVDSRACVTRLAAAVDFSSRTISGAVKAKSNFLIVHHGAFWQGATPIRGPRFRAIKSLLDNGVALYSAHLPLDCHPTLGNNVLLAEKLGLVPSSGFAQYEGVQIGLAGSSDEDIEKLLGGLSRFSEAQGGALQHTPYESPRAIGHWAMCTGSGANSETLSEAHARGIQTLIVGEGAHWTAVEAEELDIVLIYAGHYATETLGVQALAKHLGHEFGLPWSFVSAPTGR